jgi:hypothetical protein
MFLFDGARFDVWADLLSAGQLPNISRYVLAGGSFLKGYSTLPTTTGPAHVPFLYGVFAGKAGVPGIRWFDKSRAGRPLLSKAVMRSYVGTGCFAMGEDISDCYEPLYDYFTRPANIFGHLDANRGVRLRTNRLQKTLYYVRAHRTNEWDLVDEAAAREAGKRLQRGDDFVFSLFPGIDELTHLCNPTHEKVLRQYLRLDEMVGELARGLSAEELSQILFFIVSDHGLTATHTHVPLIALAEAAGHTPIFFPRIRRRHYDLAILESGNALASVYFMKPVSDRPALYGEIMSVDRNRRFVDALLAHAGIDFLAYRIDDSVLGVSGRDGVLKLDFARPPYVQLTVEGRNPLQFGVNGGQMLVSESLERTRDTNYPDSVIQLLQLFTSRRTGDIVVFPREGYDLRARYEWPEHKSSHGSLAKAHMEVPVCTNLKVASAACRTVDVFPTVLADTGRTIRGTVDGRVIL